VTVTLGGSQVASPTVVITDGGRADAGFSGDAGDCVTRAITIALDLSYRDVYDSLAARWFPTMGIGTGCRVHLRADELPEGRIIARLSRHLCAVIDGVPHDTHDPSRDGTRCVYGYFMWERV